MYHVYRMARPMNFKIGTPMEHAVRYQVLRPSITACEVGFLYAGGDIPCQPHRCVKPFSYNTCYYFTLIGSGVWVYGPKIFDNLEFYKYSCRYCFFSGADLTLIGSGCGYTLKIWNFVNIIAPKGRFPCAIFTKFIGASP